VGPEDGRATIVTVGLAGAIVAIVLFLLADLVDGPLYSFSTKTWSPELRGDKMIGGIEGAVKDVDAATNTVRIAAGFLGLTSLPLVVTPDTKIAVKGKLGGFADLDRGQLVRVAYEVRPDQLVAWRVEVLDRWSQPSDAVLPSETDSDATATEEESSSSASVPKSVAPPAEDTPRTPEPPATTLSRRSVSPTLVRQNDGSTTPATKRPTPPPSPSPRTAAPDIRRPAPAKAAPPSVPGAPQAGDDAL
jgi:hypothetical protein